MYNAPKMIIVKNAGRVYNTVTTKYYIIMYLRTLNASHVRN